MLLLLLAQVAGLLYFTSFSSGVTIDAKVSPRMLTEREIGPHCDSRFGFPNYGDCVVAWSRIPIQAALTTSLFGPSTTLGPRVITPWFASHGTCAIGVLNWPKMDEPDHSAWYDINAAVRTMLEECLATGKLGIGGYALEYGLNKNIGIFVFQTEALPKEKPVTDPVAETVQRCGWTTAETALLFQSLSSCAAVQPPAQCNTGSASGRSVGHCLSSDSCCEGYRCVFAKYTNVAIAFGAATIRDIGSCLPT